MSEGKMQRMRFNVEPEYITEDSKIRLYLSLVQREDEQRRKKAVRRKWKKILLKKKMRVLTGAMIRWFAQVLLSLATASVTAVWALPAAYKARGYWAVGGECFLILAAFLITYRIAGIFLRE